MHLAHYHYFKKHKTKLEAMGEVQSVTDDKHRSPSVTETSHHALCLELSATENQKKS